MIVILKQDCTKEQELAVTHAVESKGLKVNPVYGENQTILGLIGDIHGLNLETLSNFDGVAQVMRVSTPYKKVGRMFHPDDTVIDVAGVKICGDGRPLLSRGRRANCGSGKTGKGCWRQYFARWGI